MAWAGLGAGAGGGQGPRSSVARAEVQQKLARGICEACSLEEVSSARRSEAEADVFKLVRLGLLAARKHADLLDAYPEEQMAPVLGLIVTRGTHHRFFRGQAKECLEVLLARSGWLRLIRRDQEQLAAARALGLSIEPEVSPGVSGTWSSEEEEEEEPDSPDDELVPLRASASSDAEAVGAAWPLVEDAPHWPAEDVQELLARGRNTLQRCRWRFPPESEPPCSGPVAARGGFEGIHAGLSQLVSLADGAPRDYATVALRPLEGHWVDILGFLASMYESGACVDLRPRIAGVADMLQELSPDFQAALQEARGLPWLAVPTESGPIALTGLPSDEMDRPGSFPPLHVPGAASGASSSAESDLDRTVADLRHFMESPAGQDLIYRTHECFLYIQGMASWCRARSRYGHGSIRTLSGLTSAGAAGTVVVGGIIVAASGGIAAPAVVGAITGGLIAGAVSGGVSLANTFAALGLDMLEARFVKARIEELSKRIEVWDNYLRAALEAADNAAHGPHALSVFARAVGDYGMKASSIMSIASAIIKVNGARYDYMAVAAPQALGGMVKAGTPLAHSLMISLSGVGLICGLVDAVSAGFQMWSGYCDAADSLDAHADRFCAMLRMMRETAYDTEAQRSLIGKLPWLLLLEVIQCRVPPPDYRIFDSARQWTKRRPTAHYERRGNAYFQVTVGTRRSGTGDALVRVKPYRWTSVNRAVLLRLLRTDDAEVSIQGFDKRGIQSLMRGDPHMGREVRLQLRQPCQSRVLVGSRDRSTSFRLRYQVVRNGLSSLGQRLSQSATW